MAKFITAINCMDGRTQIPVIEFLKKNFQVDYVDMIKVHRPNRIQAELKEDFLLNHLRYFVEILVRCDSNHNNNCWAFWLCG